MALKFVSNFNFLLLDDGHLSNKEFVSVMKDKLFRGLNKVRVICTDFSFPL